MELCINIPTRGSRDYRITAFSLDQFVVNPLAAAMSIVSYTLTRLPFQSGLQCVLNSSHDSVEASTELECMSRAHRTKNLKPRRQKIELTPYSYGCCLIGGRKMSKTSTAEPR